MSGPVSQEARDLLDASDVVDLHVESFIWPRVFGYDLTAPHGHNLTGHRLWGQADLPRLASAGVTGAVLSIATNPLWPADRRREVALANLGALGATVASYEGAELVSDATGYREARSAGRLACFVGLQGGNAVAPGDLDHPAFDVVSRITLVHLTRSGLGSTSAPGGRRDGLTEQGAAYVEALAARDILLDLAHASPATFWEALAVHPAGRPLLVSHTGVKAVRPHWRNLDDDQIRAVADRGGAIGVLFHRGFLTSPGRRATAADVVAHLAHVVKVGGDDAAAIGSDFDGFILPPADLRTVEDLGRLVQAMLDAAFAPELVGKILGANALRVIGAMRPATPAA